MLCLVLLVWTHCWLSLSRTFTNAGVMTSDRRNVPSRFTGRLQPAVWGPTRAQSAAEGSPPNTTWVNTFWLTPEVGNLLYPVGPRIWRRNALRGDGIGAGQPCRGVFRGGGHWDMPPPPWRQSVLPPRSPPSMERLLFGSCALSRTQYWWRHWPLRTS